MLKFLKNHPFAVEAYFEKSLVFTFAFPKADLAPLLPPCLSLDTFEDQWAFVAIAMVETKHLRPKGFPKWIGNDFFLIGYRIFVRYHTSYGKRLRGLYILKSETNKAKMETLGNIFTHYNYTTTDIEQKIEENSLEISSQKSDFKVHIQKDLPNIALPESTPFADWKQARRFAGPLPFTFTYKADKQQVLIIEGVRQNWQPKPVKVLSYHFSFLENEQFPFKNAILANAFIIEQVPYHWKKGRIDLWQP